MARGSGVLRLALWASLLSVAWSLAIPTFFASQGDLSWLLSRGDASGSLNAQSVGFLKCAP